MRFTLPVVAHVFLLRGESILLARRHGTGFADGLYGPVGGHLDGAEPATAATVRECREEIGVEIDPGDLVFVGVVHYASPGGEGIDLFFSCTRWVGEPRPVADCDEVRWCSRDELPEATIPFVRRAIAHHLIGRDPFDEDGWEQLTPLDAETPQAG
jgi:8-oxo-dGTP diphosphatase